MFGPIALGSALLGLIAGILISHAGYLGPGWFRPEVLGSIAGAFLAAMIGLGGAAWVHFAGVNARKAEKHDATQRATASVFVSMLGIYALLGNYERELAHCIRTGKIRMGMVIAAQHHIRTATEDLLDLSRSDALQANIAAAARQIARNTPLMFGFEPDLKKLPDVSPITDIAVPETDRKRMETTRQTTIQQREGLRAIPALLEDDYDILEDKEGGTEAAIERMTAMHIEAFVPSWTD